MLARDCAAARARSPARSATPRSATGARSAARSPTATRPRTCRRGARARRHACRPGPGRGAGDPGLRLLPRVPGDRARPRRAAGRDPGAEGRPHGHSYQKFVRRAQDWAIVGAAAAWARWPGGRVARNVAPTPVRARGSRTGLASGASAAEAAELAAEGLEPSGDINATPDFRRHLARVLTRRALEEAGV